MERKVIIEEMRMYGDMPLSKLYSIAKKRYFKGTSLEHDILGDEQTVKSFTRKDFIEFRNSLYKPENTVFVVTGNFNHDEIYGMVKRVLNPMTNNNLVPKTYFDEKAIILKNMNEFDQPYVYVKRNTFYQQAYAVLTFPMYDLYDKMGAEIDLLSHLLTTGFSSRLVNSLRGKKGITYTVSSYPMAYTDAGLFIIQMIVNPVELIDALKIIMKELRRVKKNKISPDEHKKIINIMTNEILFSLVQPLEILTYYGLATLYNRGFKSNIKKELPQLQKITTKDIQDIANKIFIRDKLNLFIYGNVLETDFDFLDL